MSVRTQADGIAVVGIGALFPGALGPADFWRNILGARELIRDVPSGYWLPEDFYDPNPRTRSIANEARSSIRSTSTR
jgi:acyl transferase domain-containing protein